MDHRPVTSTFRREFKRSLCCWRLDPYGDVVAKGQCCASSGGLLLSPVSSSLPGWCRVSLPSEVMGALVKPVIVIHYDKASRLTLTKYPQCARLRIQKGDTVPSCSCGPESHGNPGQARSQCQESARKGPFFLFLTLLPRSSCVSVTSGLWESGQQIGATQTPTESHLLGVESEQSSGLESRALSRAVDLFPSSITEASLGEPPTSHCLKATS